MIVWVQVQNQCLALAGVEVRDVSHKTGPNGLEKRPMTDKGWTNDVVVSSDFGGGCVQFLLSKSI